LWDGDGKEVVDVFDMWKNQGQFTIVSLRIALLLVNDTNWSESMP
jgi:hypothetical protein